MITEYRKRAGDEKGYIYAFALLLITTRFFDLLFLPSRPFVFVGEAILIYFYAKSKEDQFRHKQLIGILWLMILGSIIYSTFVNKQSMVDVAFSSYFATGLASFFIFRRLNISYVNCIKLIRNFSILFCICYLLQWIVYPIEIFSGVQYDNVVNDDQYRMRMTCSACSYCLFFWGVSSFMKNHKTINLIYSLLGFTSFLIMGFRSLIILSLLFLLYLIIAYNKKNRLKTIVYVIMFGIVSFFLIKTTLVQEKISEMMERQETKQTFDNQEYVRYTSLYYYLSVYDTPMERLIGGGIPILNEKTSNNNDYALEVLRGYQSSLYWNDLGLVGFGFVFGFPSVFLLSFLLFRTIIRCRDKSLLFIRVTLLTIFLGSIFTSQELYRTGNFLFIGLLMYTEYKYYVEKNENRNINISQRL